VCNRRTGCAAWLNGRALTQGPDGNQWFTENSGTIIGRLLPSGHLDEFTVPGFVGGGEFLCRDLQWSRRNLWFVDGGDNAIGRTTPAASDGALWFTEQRATRIGKITTPPGLLTEFSTAAEPSGAQVALAPLTPISYQRALLFQRTNCWLRSLAA